MILFSVSNSLVFASRAIKLLCSWFIGSDKEFSRLDLLLPFWLCSRDGLVMVQVRHLRFELQEVTDSHVTFGK